MLLIFFYNDFRCSGGFQPSIEKPTGEAAHFAATRRASTVWRPPLQFSRDH